MPPPVHGLGLEQTAQRALLQRHGFLGTQLMAAVAVDTVTGIDAGPVRFQGDRPGGAGVFARLPEHGFGKKRPILRRPLLSRRLHPLRWAGKALFVFVRPVHGILPTGGTDGRFVCRANTGVRLCG